MFSLVDYDNSDDEQKQSKPATNKKKRIIVDIEKLEAETKVEIDETKPLTKKRQNEVDSGTFLSSLPQPKQKSSTEQQKRPKIDKDGEVKEGKKVVKEELESEPFYPFEDNGLFSKEIEASTSSFENEYSVTFKSNIHPSAQYAVNYDEAAGSYSYKEEIDKNEGDEDEIPQEAYEQLYGLKTKKSGQVVIQDINQKDILESEIDLSQGYGMKSLTNEQFARRNHITQLISISKQQEDFLKGFHNKAKNTRKEASQKYGW